MNRNIPTFLLLLSFAVFAFCQSPKQPKVLVFSKTKGYYHTSIPDGIMAIQKIGKESGFLVDTTTDATHFTDKVLKQYAAVVFLSTTGDVLDSVQEASFKRYINAGGGFMGVHAASDTEYDWGWYGQLVGGYFESHPETQKATLEVVNPNHTSTRDLPKQWTRVDEWYNFKNLNPNMKVLLTIDETTYKGGKNGDYHPMAWYHELEGGRAFYTSLGHTKESYQDPLFLKHLTGGLLYVIGDKNDR
ncbi:MAG TPA: ThuA domain-containing protein [Flavisolibacter sp.]|nr:ThuA domain-containing protein [Flavisolibacter sp.]